jgi:hypothetical protein
MNDRKNFEQFRIKAMTCFRVLVYRARPDGSNSIERIGDDFVILNGKHDRWPNTEKLNHKYEVVHRASFDKLPVPESKIEPLVGLTMTLEELPAGSLFKFKDVVGFKTDYHNMFGFVKAYLLGSGLLFLGGVETAQQQRDLLVTELIIELDK